MRSVLRGLKNRIVFSGVSMQNTLQSAENGQMGMSGAEVLTSDIFFPTISYPDPRNMCDPAVMRKRMNQSISIHTVGPDRAGGRRVDDLVSQYQTPLLPGGMTSV